MNSYLQPYYVGSAEGSFHPQSKQAVRQLLSVIKEFPLFWFKGVICFLLV